MQEIKPDTNQIIVQKSQMGSTEAFLGTVTLEWLARRVLFASQLPLFREKFEPQTHNVIRDAETIEGIQQRPLDWSRQAILTQYLITQKNHKFPPVLVVISPSWVDNPHASLWDSQQKAIKSAVDFTPFSQNEHLGYLDVSENISIFALDGQHRLMGIQGLMELLGTGKIPRYNKQKKPTGSLLTVDDLIDNHKIDLDYLHNLAQEKIGIEFIPAVVSGETRDQAKRRVRSIFVHVNLMSIQLSKGQLALLNEDDGFSIVARKIAVIHPLFKTQKGRTPRINWDSANISAKSTVLTTLQALQLMAEEYLSHKFPQWKTKNKGLIPERPSDEELELGNKYFGELFTGLANLPSYQQLNSNKDIIKIRRFSHERPGGEGNFLFRPVGQVALAEALGVLVFKKDFALPKILDKLHQFDALGGFLGIDFPQSLWYGVIYDPTKQRIMISGRSLAAKILIYLLGGMEDFLERAYLREDLIKARTIQGKAIAFDGTFVTSQEINLPPTI
jgi:DGQHR domain-containing protein